MPELTFTKFPKAVHLGRAIQEDIIPPGPYEITEKLDGANAGFQRVGDSILVHSRNTVVGCLFLDNPELDRTYNEFRGLVQYVASLRLRLQDLKDGEHVFGEWLVPHTLRYPDNMWKHFYAFDAEQAAALDLRHVARIDYTPELPDPEWLEERLQRYKEDLDRPVEGFVITPYGESPYRPRFKLVPREFQEQARAKWGGNKQDQGPAEERLVLYYSTRSYEKLLEKVEDVKGKLTRSETGAVLNMAWNDYCQEFLGPALKDERYPTVDTNALRQNFFDRIREMYLTQLDTGHLPQWAEGN